MSGCWLRFGSSGGECAGGVHQVHNGWIISFNEKKKIKTSDAALRLTNSLLVLLAVSSLLDSATVLLLFLSSIYIFMLTAVLNFLTAYHLLRPRCTHPALLVHP